MNRTIWRKGTILVLFLSLVTLAGWGQGMAPKGIIPTPPEATDFQVSIFVDRGAYAVGESISIRYSVNRSAYIYIWDITPDGQANQIFPNSLPGGSANYAVAGVHAVPGSWQIAPPVGTEYLQILATTSPVDPFVSFIGDPRALQAQVEAQILGILPATERTWNFTSFDIVSGTAPVFGTLDIRSTPSGASVILDSQYVGYTPRTLFVSQGTHQLAISKPGYQTWQSIMYILGNPTRTINAVLVGTTAANQVPTVAFTFAPSSPGVGVWVQFDASASFVTGGTINSYAWSFGDGSTGSGATVWHRFASAGNYNANLVVTDDRGASANVTELVQVGPTNQPPVAAFVADSTATVPGEWIRFDASTSYDPDGAITGYAWSFGDGTSSSGIAGWHRFTNAGTYLVTLTVTDSGGVQDAVSQSILVGAQDIPPTAAFIYTPSSPAVYEWIRLDATSSYDADGTIASYQWLFAGGATETGNVVYRQFTAAGLHTVTLTVTDNRGVANTVSQQVQVGTSFQAPVAAFTYSPTSPSVGVPVTLDATSSYDSGGSIVSYQWDLNGDGVHDLSGPVGQVRYLSAGLAVVRLTVVDNSGLSASITKTIAVLSSGGTPSGTPDTGTTAGIFVWGTDSWHVTVNAGVGWTSPRAYRIELRTDGGFSTINQSSSGVAPLGILPAPALAGKTLIFAGSIQSGSVDHTFTVPGSTSLWMSLKMDTNGNGTLDEATSFVSLRSSLAHPPANPFVVGLPSGYAGDLLPSLNFRIGTAASYSETVRFIFWSTTISALEGP